ncbi:MAG: GDSL-type esterase/lipase family protein [Candidatus Woesearchaeota archaeon]|nr:GDSL-type esterase/lipase family protein [Candidatus Woesearchaeota archaeon]
MKDILKKTALAIIGILLGLAIIELSLRAAGAIIYLQQRLPKYLDNRDNYVIVAIGESTTADAFNGEGSWPEELQKELDMLHTNTTYVVINEGVPGTNTNFILLRLEEVLKKHEPDMVISMMGINDFPTEYSFERSNLRIQRFISWARWNLGARRNNCREEYPDSLKEKVDLAFSYADEWKFYELEMLLKDIESANNCNTFITIGNIYLNLAAADGSREKKIGYFKKAASFFQLFADDHPDSAAAAYNLAGTYIQLYDATKEKSYLTQAYKIITETKNTIALPPHETYPVSLSLLIKMNDSDNEIERFYNTYEWQYNLIKRDKPITETQYNLIWKELNKKGISYIAMQYPLEDPGIIAGYFKDGTRPIIIGNKENFEQSLLDHDYEELFVDRFAGNFGHTTRMGNKLIAKNLAETVRNLSSKPGK